VERKTGWMMGRSVLKTKSYTLAIHIAKLSKILKSAQKEDVLSKLVLRSGTAIGAVIREADHARNRQSYKHKMKMALKEVNETYYWLSILRDTDYLEQKQFERLEKSCNEISVMLVSDLGTSRQ
jgi:four helix bundle protein